MSYILSAEEHKALVKTLFKQNHEADALVKKLEKIGFSTIEGFVGRMIYGSWDVIRHVTPDYIVDTDGFVDDFSTMEDFEAFYEKYYTEERMF